MAKLVWTQTGPRSYESGVDHGVLYPGTGLGLVWNGLVSVSESFVGGEAMSYHYDGIKYLDMTSAKDYQAQISAFSAPAEFSDCIGEKSVVKGMVLTRQPRSRFAFSYRTNVGEGYKLNLVYNALASAVNRGYTTLQPGVSVPTFSWNIDAVPPASSTYRPSAHFVLDSTKMDPAVLAEVETILYGSLTTNATLITIEELETIVNQ